jgi:SAM-dependent methyltransferase
MKKFSINRKKHDDWLRKVLPKKKFDLVINLGSGPDVDYYGETYTSYINADKILKVEPDKTYEADHRAKAEEMDFLEDGSVDFVFMNWAIYYCDVEKVAKEICRVLKPDGKVAISYTQRAGDDGGEATRAITKILNKYFTTEEFYECHYIRHGEMLAQALFGGKRCGP